MLVVIWWRSTYWYLRGFGCRGGVGDLVFNQTWVMEPGASGAIVTPLISTSDLREELDVNTYFNNTYTILISTSDHREEPDL